MSSDGPKGAAKDGAQSDPDSGLVAQSCFDFLLIELVPLAQRIAEQLYQDELRVTGAKVEKSDTASVTSSAKGASTAKSGRKEKPQSLDEEELRDATFFRLEGLGYRVGLGVVESLSADHPLISPPVATAGSTAVPANHLDTIKFLCKDLWTAVFRKQIDNLKTNHRGVFVLTDNRFEPLRRCSLPAYGGAGGGGAEEAARRAALFLFFPAGLIRGALSGLGVEATVSADVAPVGLPGAVFQIKTVPVAPK